MWHLPWPCGGLHFNVYVKSRPNFSGSLKIFLNTLQAVSQLHSPVIPYGSLNFGQWLVILCVILQLEITFTSGFNRWSVSKELNWRWNKLNWKHLQTVKEANGVCGGGQGQRSNRHFQQLRWVTFFIFYRTFSFYAWVFLWKHFLFAFYNMLNSLPLGCWVSWKRHLDL